VALNRMADVGESAIGPDGLHRDLEGTPGDLDAWGLIAPTANVLAASP